MRKHSSNFGAECCGVLTYQQAAIQTVETNAFAHILQVSSFLAADGHCMYMSLLICQLLTPTGLKISFRKQA